jgi:DNA-binding protein YbaB
MEELTQQFDRMRSGAADLQQRISEVEVTERSSDGHVTATVGPRGQLVRLELDPRLYRNPDSVRLADTIIETVQVAAEKAIAQVTELCETLVPAEDVAAHMNFDLDGIMRRLDHELPGGDWK